MNDGTCRIVEAGLLISLDLYCASLNLWFSQRACSRLCRLYETTDWSPFWVSVVTLIVDNSKKEKTLKYPMALGCGEVNWSFEKGVDWSGKGGGCVPIQRGQRDNSQNSSKEKVPSDGKNFSKNWSVFGDVWRWKHLWTEAKITFFRGCELWGGVGMLWLLQSRERPP